MPEAAAIGAIQGWMQAVILAGGAPAGEVRERIRGDNRLTAEARLGIYADAYRLRLLECLRAEYPLLAALAGPTAFDLFALGYIAAAPSRSFTLYDVGAGFADHLAATRPPHSTGEQAIDAIPAALARLERAIAEASRARGTEDGPAADSHTGLDPTLAPLLGIVRPRTYRRPDSVRLLELPFDFTALFAAAPDAPLPLPEPTPTWIAVARLRWRVRCHRLDEAQHRWLAALPGVDAPHAASAPPRKAALAAWLPQAEAQSLVVAI